MSTYPFSLPIVFLEHKVLPSYEHCFHDTYDILYILSGQCLITSDSELLYPEGSICLIQPHTEYIIRKSSDGFFLHLGILEDFFTQNLPAFGTLQCDSLKEPGNDYSSLKELLSALSAKYLEAPDKNHLFLLGLLYQLLALMEEKYFYNNFSGQLPDKYIERIQIITDYIDAHYTEPLTLTKLAEHLYLTPQYLSKFFKDYLHKNFKDYLTEKRLYHSYRALCFTNWPVTDIALHCGFTNAAVFSKAFRNFYHMTPTDCREKFKRKNLETEYSSFDTLAHETSPVPLPPQEKAMLSAQRISSSVLKTQKIKNNYCSLLNIGSVHNLLLQDFQEDLLTARSELGIHYVRIQETISSSFIPKVLPDYEFYFHNLDTAFWTLYDMHLIPFIELSELPYNYNSFFDSEIPFTFRGKRYFELLEVFLEHCRSTFPEDWFSLWKFELWMNPTDTAQTYAADFNRIQQMIHTRLPGAVLGGPGISSGFHKESLEHLLSDLFAAGCRPGFISAHFSLQVDTGNQHIHISTDPDLLLEETRLAAKLIQHHYPSVPFYLTEWTSLFFSDLPVHASCFQAAFICHTIADLSEYYDLMGYWTFTDRFLPSSANRQKPSIWGHGLLDRNHLKMPAYHAFSFLNKLGNLEIDRGRNYIITQSAPAHYQILAFNYTHFIAENAFQHDTLPSFANVYQLFSDAQTTRMEFSLQGLLPGTYQIRRYFLNRANGSILDILIGGYLNGNIDEAEYLMKVILPTENTVRYFRNSCIPEERAIYLDVTDELHASSDILPHNVCLWDIVKLY